MSDVMDSSQWLLRDHVIDQNVRQRWMLTLHLYRMKGQSSQSLTCCGPDRKLMKAAPLTLAFCLLSCWRFVLKCFRK